MWAPSFFSSFSPYKEHEHVAETTEEPIEQAASNSGLVVSLTATNESVSVMQQRALERRLAWLEEDFRMQHRKAQETYGITCARDKDAEGDNMSLRDLAQRFQKELQEERVWRSQLEDQVNNMHADLIAERALRETSLKKLAQEVEKMLRHVVLRIDDGLSEETKVLNQRAQRMEDALHSLIARIESGMAAGSQALQRTLQTAKEKQVAGAVVGADSTTGSSEGRTADAESVLSGTSSSNKGTTNVPASPPAHRFFEGSLLDKVLCGSKERPVPTQPAKTSIATKQSVAKPRESKAGDAMLKAPDTPMSEPLQKVWDQLQEEQARLLEQRAQLHRRKHEFANIFDIGQDSGRTAQRGALVGRSAKTIITGGAPHPESSGECSSRGFTVGPATLQHAAAPGSSALVVANPVSVSSGVSRAQAATSSKKPRVGPTTTRTYFAGSSALINRM